MTEWSEERIKELKAKWLEGKSASVIAAELGGVSRNAVIGKAHRLDLTPRQVGGTRTQIVKPLVRAPRLIKEKRDESAAINAMMERAAAFESIPAPVPLNFTVMELKRNDCRWPVSGEKAETLFCGHDIGEASVYCAYHYRMARGRGTQSERNVDALLRRVA